MWDFVIIGAGSSGCALAYHLARDAPDKSILILEAGPSDRSALIRVPAGQMRAIRTYDWGFATEPDESRDGKTENWPRGRVLGGSSSINGTMYVRGCAHDYDRWNAGLSGWNGPGWSAAEVLPIFDEIENRNRAAGKGGAVNIRTVRHAHRLTRNFVDAARSTGLPFNADYNGPDQEGVAYAQLSQSGRLRCSAADAFLKPILGRPNIKLLLDAHVDAIEFEGRVASGVRFTRHGRSETAAARQVILSAGSIKTPQLLMLSGIGETGHLSAHGIRTKLELPGVGRNLAEHPLVGFTFKTRIPSFNLTEGIAQKLGYVLKYASGREGPLANPFEATAFLRSSAKAGHPDLQLHFMPVGYYVSGEGRYLLQPYPSVTVLLNLSYPRSRGRIALRDHDPRSAPLIQCRLFDDPGDLEALVDGVERVRDIVRAQPLSDLIEEEIYPGPAISERGAVRDYVRRSAGTALHPVGTCRMGLDDLAVVAPDLRVRGTDNLWIADASIMPDLISGNTNAACLMIGAKLGMQLVRS